MSGFSIIVPVHRVEEYLGSCVSSIFSSDCRDYQLLLVDDGSPDRCGGECDEYAWYDERVCVIHKGNEGLSSARNVGMDIADGEIFAFVDSDDRVNPAMFGTMISEMKRYHADIVCCGMTILGSDSIPFKAWPEQDEIYEQTDAIQLLLKSEGTGDFYMNKIFRRSLFDTVRLPVGKIYEDIYTMHEIFGKSERTVFLSKGLYEYRINSAGISHSGKIQPDFVLASYKQYEYVLKNCPKFRDLALGKYVNAINLNMRAVVLKKVKRKRVFYGELRKRVIELGNTTERLPPDLREACANIRRSFLSCVRYYRIKKWYEDLHNHPSAQALLRKVFKGVSL